jgi:non-heme chloroperoxidase
MTRPVVFVHGPWIHAASWLPWRELFAAEGYETHAPGWPGDADTPEATRADPSPMVDVGVERITASYAEVIAGLAVPPIVVGHSVGGLVAEKLLDQGRATAVVAISPAPVRGIRVLPLAQLRSSFPVLSRPRNRHRALPLTADHFADAFGNALDRAESDELYHRYAIPGPGRPLFETATAAFSRHSPTAVDTGRADRGPLLLMAAGRDHTVPAAVTRAAHRLYAASPADTELATYPDRGHSAPFDHGWRALADDVLDWLARRGL